MLSGVRGMGSDDSIPDPSSENIRSDFPKIYTHQWTLSQRQKQELIITTKNDSERERSAILSRAYSSHHGYRGAQVKNSTTTEATGEC